MGREVKRVLLDFEWPLWKVWEGYLPRDREDYDPPEGEGWQMWETTSEGSPISPVFRTPEELARWLVEEKVPSFGFGIATYEQWLAMILEGWAPSAVMLKDGRLISGVEDAERRKRS